MSRLFSAILVAAALVIGGSQNANAIVNGWNLWHIASCYGGTVNNIQYLYITNTSGESIFLTNEFDIGSAAQFCANGNAFWVNIALPPNTITALYFVPGLK
jgi:hypothetical protein